MDLLNRENDERYFAASNSKDGFISRFDEIFSQPECDKTYILKGGPGCGKSTFMRLLGKKAEDMGCSCEYFHCSSDPSSLDGIIIKERRIAVVDGTSPHTVEPKLSGASEILIDLGRCWDTDGLFKKRGELMDLSSRKKAAYNDCFCYLNAKSVMDNLIYNLAFPYILFDKLDKSSARLAKSIIKKPAEKSGGTVRTRLSGAFSSLGKIRLFTFENKAKVCIFLKEHYKDSKLPFIFLRNLFERARLCKTSVCVSMNPQNKNEIDALFFPDTGVSVSLYDEDFVSECDKNLKKCRIINCAKFIDSKSFSHLRPLRKFYSKLSENMERQALESISKAGEIHAETEKIYRTCTDYKTVDKISEEYFKQILFP